MESLHTNEREHLCQERAGLRGLGYCRWKWQYQDFPKVEPGTLRFGCPIANSGPFPEGFVKTCMGTPTRVNLKASSISRVRIPRIFNHDGHPLTVGSRHFERYPIS